MRIFGSTFTSKLLYKLLLLITLTLIFLLVGTSESSDQSKEKTLKEIKDELLGKEVVLLGTKSNIYDSLFGWKFALEDAKGGFENSYRSVPYKMKGTRGIVVFIGQSKLFGRKAVVDAFGEKIRDEDIVDSQIDIVVRLQNGSLVMYEGYYSRILNYELKILSDFEETRNQILSRIDSLVGKTIYPVAYSCVFPPDSEIDIMAGHFITCIGYKLDIPNLTPLKIVKVKYLEKQHAILLKVEFLNGKTGLIFRDLNRLRTPITEQKLLDEGILGFYENIDKHEDFKGITEKEVQAIKKGTIFRGMSENALHFSIGFPSKENDWGRGGKQLIYYDRIYVYIKDGKVIDWQVMSK